VTFRGQILWSARWGGLALVIALLAFALDRGGPGGVLWFLGVATAVVAAFLLVLGVAHRAASRWLWRRIIVRRGWHAGFLMLTHPQGAWLWWVHTDAKGADLDDRH
jgi:hypothetical protein